ncbi:hypothetical protein [Streptomyces viridochromogenes]|uniref:Uncharacterized protein n=1 Tax=Streptomyces viridochromogenes Tue57 TaxID=1160705 RepID=L8P411_STRVR|nr:hypothetical protein [Streptomyces viridochromogenes]ELS50924.1 hypothetical protein STVIR_8147 [Streptomyces viridochromogenes Tue57]
MWKRGKGARPARRATPLELCDLCAAAFPEDEAVRGYVPDSSAVHPTNDWFDGLRRVTACGDAHFVVLRDTYRRRPFVEEELWAAKITRVLTSGPPVATMEQLGCRTGLYESEIRRAMAWHNEERRQRGQP